MEILNKIFLTIYYFTPRSYKKEAQPRCVIALTLWWGVAASWVEYGPEPHPLPAIYLGHTRNFLSFFTMAATPGGSGTTEVQLLCLFFNGAVILGF